MAMAPTEMRTVTICREGKPPEAGCRFMDLRKGDCFLVENDPTVEPGWMEAMEDARCEDGIYLVSSRLLASTD